MEHFHQATELFIYYGRVLWRAFLDTFRHLARQVFVGLVLLFLGTLLRCEDLPAGEVCELSDARVGLLAVGLYFGLVFAFNIAMAPVRIHRELSERVASEAEPSAEPVVVEYIEHEARPDLRYVMEGWEFDAYQTASGIGLSWWTRFPSRGIGAAPLPLRVASRTPITGDGYAQTETLMPGWESERVEFVYPRDFPGANATTGSIEVEWLAARNDTRWVALPPLPVLRGERSQTPEETQGQVEAGKQVVACASLSVKIRVTQGGKLV